MVVESYQKDILYVLIMKNKLKSEDKIMAEFTLREYTQEEYEADMKKLLVEKGLYKAVKSFCDEINSLSGNLDYRTHRDIQENLCDILFLIEKITKEDKMKANETT